MRSVAVIIFTFFAFATFATSKLIRTEEISVTLGGSIECDREYFIDGTTKLYIKPHMAVLGAAISPWVYIGDKWMSETECQEFLKELKDKHPSDFYTNGFWIDYLKGVSVTKSISLFSENPGAVECFSGIRDTVTFKLWGINFRGTLDLHLLHTQVGYGPSGDAKCAEQMSLLNLTFE